MANVYAAAIFFNSVDSLDISISREISIAEPGDNCVILVNNPRMGQKITLRDEMSASLFCKGLLWNK
jgi:2-oxo-4-hydroxy-4-carboxy--5-ureidoimidazoline (OHCU) decarboxylase